MNMKCGFFRQIVAATALLTGLCCMAQVKPGDNLLVNGQLEADQANMPPFWNPTSGAEHIRYIANSGLPGLGCLTLSSDDGAKEAVIRQAGLQLVAGERYRLSAMVRTKDFESGHYGVIVCNQGWFSSQGILAVERTQDWTAMSVEFDAAESSSGTYAFIVFAIKFKGELSVADLRLEALTKAGQDGSKRSLQAENALQPRLVPVEPLLHRIPTDRPEVTFRFFGRLLPNLEAADNKPEDYDIVWKCGDEPEVVQPLKKPLNVLTLPKNRPWRGKLETAIRSHATGEIVLRQVHDVETIDVRELNPAGHRRLNNLVTEILHADLQATAEEQRFEFVNVRNGWLYLAVRDAGAAPVELHLGDDVVIRPDAAWKETFRERPEGSYVVAVKGAANGGQLIVRQIADIFNYCPGSKSFVGENGDYDWPIMSKYMLRAVTTLNGGSIPEGHLDEVRDSGYHWLANINTTPDFLKDEANLHNRLLTHNGFTMPCYDGVTCDELFFWDASQIIKFTNGIKSFENPQDRLIYTWVVGKPSTNAIDYEFISTCINASRSRGHLLYEIYCRTKETEEQAQAYIRNYAQKSAEAMKQLYPNVMGNLGIIFGNFNQIPIITLIHHPSVDYKYFLDMQLNLVANDPAFEGLGTVGYWGSYYADRELYRWSSMLLRHYCVEGRTDMLSNQYGFRYISGHIQNGDFAGTLAPWTANGNVTTDSFDGFAAASQNRWGGNDGLGDTFAVFTKEGDETSTLSQQVTGLVPGRLYCLQFCTGDADDIKAKRLNPRKFGISANLGDGAEVDPACSWIHVDMRKDGRYAYNNNVARVNLHHIVFKATASETTLTFSNAEAIAGEHLALNFVMLHPFLDGDEK